KRIEVVSNRSRVVHIRRPIMKKGLCGLAGALVAAWRESPFNGIEDDHAPRGELSFAIGAACGLNDAGKGTKRPENKRKIQINACFHHLRADQAAGFPLSQATLDFIQHHAAMCST